MARRVWEPTAQQPTTRQAQPTTPQWEEEWDAWLEKEGSVNMNLLPGASRFGAPPLSQPTMHGMPPMRQGQPTMRLPATPNAYTPPNYTPLPPAPPMPPMHQRAAAPPSLMGPPMQGLPPQANPAFAGAAGQAAPNLSQTQDRELVMWQQWKKTGRSEDLYAIVTSMNPLVFEEANKWRGRVKAVPDAAIEAEFRGHAVDAIKNYDPSRGAKLSTWVKSNLRRGGRFVKTYQNTGRIVEKRTEVIGDYNQTKAELGEALNRPPTEREMLASLKQKRPDYRWTNNEVKRMESELRADILSSAFESDMNVFSPSLDAEIAQHMHEELNEDERKVWKHIQNPGKTQGKTGLIAKELGWLDPKVSRMRKSIEAKALDLRRRLR